MNSQPGLSFLDYESPSEEELLTITWLDRLANRLGNPTDIESQSGLTLLDAIIGAWMKHFPAEASAWSEDVKTDLENEKSLGELTSIHSIGYNPASYPPSLFKLLKAMFPNLKLQDRIVWKKLIKLYPGLFKTSNYA